MEFSFQSNVDQWTAGLEEIYRRQIPFATAQALNETVEDIRDYHQTILPVIFDRPTRYTLSSLRVLKTTSRGDLIAGVYFKDQNRRRQHYLMPQVEGGNRPHKAFETWLIRRGVMRSNEYAVPASGLKLDAYGNVSAGVITSILSQMAAGPDAMQWETKRSRKRAGPSRNRYFVPQPGSSLRRGIWRRKGKTAIEPVFIFVSGVTYQKRYDFYGISVDRAMSYFPVNFERALIAGIEDQRSYRMRSGLSASASNWTMPSIG
ncbi:hypothetical protein [Rhizobium mongolense]|uniref:Uncharacterized protein n=1 Tax=Rhizobium mongolense TaxID=57676 RepID=A0A7W6RSB9_9HYPH|nr:hypothetical protein [Rhizobium mongolense]MBB4277038.1 hypothetical protein [Rhizobium mongolense]